MREVVVFNKRGNKVGRLEVPNLIYLQTEKDWITRHLNLATNLDGIALLVDWEKKELTSIRYAEEND